MKLLINLISMIVAASMLMIACSPHTPVKMAHSDLQRDVNPKVGVDDVTTLVDGNNAFAFNLYRSLKAGTGNVVFSPYSISLALAMTYAGARNETESQMAEALNFTLPQERLHPAFNKLDLTLQQESQPQSNGGQALQLDIANAVWAEQTFAFLQPFLDLLARNYGSGLELADFVNEPAAVRNEINQWVSDQTHEKIKDLIPQGAIDTMTRLVLVNAIYFKADWEDQFDPTDTKDESFHLVDGSTIRVKMMSENISGAQFSTGDGYKAVELNYLGKTAAMDIFIPDEGKFDEFEGRLDASKYNGILAGMQPKTLRLGLPKFTYTNNSDLSDRLSSLGMSDAFDPNLADFSGMSGSRDLVISKVQHQAFVAVDEKGTEAAAATSVIMQPTSIMLPGETLTIDRPFIFVIRDLASKQILFIGRVLNPNN